MNSFLVQLLLVGCDESEAIEPPVDTDGDGWVDAQDCVPTDPAVNPSASEICDNGVDDDCDGGADECRLQGHVPVDTLSGVALSEEGAWREYRMASIADIDGDERPDILVGAPGHAEESGRLYVLASSQPLPTSLAAAWASIEGSADEPELGSAVAGVGDLDGDGQDDFVARFQPNDTSERYYSVLGFGFPSAGPAGVDTALVRWESDHGYLAHAVSGGGDLTGDGWPDVAFSLHGERTDAGPVPQLVVFGPPTQSVESEPLVALFEDESTSLHHNVLSTLARSDIDGDGLDDLIVGASMGGYGEGWSSQGLVMHYSGPVLGHIFIENADHLVVTAESGARSDPFVFEGGDMDADGIDDVIVGDPAAGDETRAVYVLTSDWPDVAADATRSVFGGANHRLLGDCAAGLGDVDGDGAADLLVTDPSYSTDSIGLEGAAYLFYGPIVGAQTIDSAGFWTTGVDPDEGVGDHCAAVGDWNGDGRPDFGFTSERWSTFPYPDTSKLFLGFGAGI